MHRPLRDPLYVRIWHLIRGLLFYNTVYWRRASDGLNMPSLTAEERERQRPERNLEIIRPRMRPRAHIEATRGGEVSNPPATPETLPGVGGIRAHALVQESLPPPRSENAVPPPPPPRMVPPGNDGTEQVYVKRRRYRRRLVSRSEAGERDGFFARVFGKK